jgi:hypothetical protein
MRKKDSTDHICEKTEGNQLDLCWLISAFQVFTLIICGALCGP